MQYPDKSYIYTVMIIPPKYEVSEVMSKKSQATSKLRIGVKG